MDDVNYSAPERLSTNAGQVEPSEHQRSECETRAVVLTRITATKPKLLTKRFDLHDGDIVKTAVANLAEGHAEQVSITDLSALSEFLDELKHSQAVCYGIAAGHPKTRIVSQARQNGAQAIARTRRYFGFPRAPGVMFLDYDPRDTALEPQELIKTLRKAAPALGTAPMLWRPSASYGVAGRVAGQRIYIPVLDAALIPEAGKALVQLLWADGHGHYQIGKAGQALERCLVDATVWQPERLDFAAAPVLGEGVTRTAPASFIDGDPGALFDLRGLIRSADGNVIARADTNRKHARVAIAEPLALAREQWLVEEAPRLAERSKIPLEQARAVLELAASKLLLTGDFALTAADGKAVSVGELLDNPAQWHGKRFADPLEPGYSNGDQRIAWANLRGGRRPQIYSHAHGGRRFYLVRPSADIELRKGQRASVVDRLLDLVRERGELYDYGDDCVLARIADEGHIVPCTADWMIDHLDRIARFHRTRNTAEGEERVDDDAPQWAARRVLAAQFDRQLQRLDGVINAPTMRGDGSLLVAPGYDPATRLLYISDTPETVHIPEEPTTDDARAALGVLWAPFCEFPLVDDVDRGVVLSALLTAVLRGSLLTAPGFGFDAPAPGTGKTLLAQAVGALVGGTPPVVLPPATGGDEEARKRLFAALLSGMRTLLWDNVREPLGTAALDAFLTAPTFADRNLGKSEVLSLPNRALFLATGNNLRLVGDTCRRILPARLDAKMERPYSREFDWCPLALTVDRRMELIAAALTLIRACRVSGWTRTYSGRSASFETWDRLVRESVCWVASLDHEGQRFADPLKATERAFERDPDTTKLAALLSAWKEHAGSKPITSAGLIEVADNGASELRGALSEIASDRRGNIDARHLGNWLRTHLERRVGGLRITEHAREGKTNASKKWCLAAEEYTERF